MLRQAVGDHIIWVSDGCVSPRAADACKTLCVEGCPDVVAPVTYNVSIRRTSPNLRFAVSGGWSGGLPIPLDVVAFRMVMMPNDIDLLTSSDDASMMRLAVALAELGHYPDPAYVGAARDPDAKRLAAMQLSPAWRAELSRNEGRLRYHSSVYVGRAVGGDVRFCTRDLASFRPLLVSGNLSWGTKAVFDGYLSAFKALGVDVSTFEYDEYIRNFSGDVSRKILLGELANRSLGFTHGIFIDGLSVPPWLIQSSPLVNVLVSTEDPHVLDITRQLYPYYDYVFTNERSVADFLGHFYLPVAADHSAVGVLPRPVPQEYRSDVLFVGALYPGRLPWLRAVQAICGEMGATFSAFGPRLSGSSMDAFFSGLVKEATLTTRENLLRQAGAKVVLNIFRDVKDDRTGKNAEFGIPGASMNPRCYDTPLCGASLLTDRRDEIADVLGEDCIATEENLAALLAKNLESEEWRQEKVLREAKTVSDRHLYLHRAMTMMTLMEQGLPGRSEKDTGMNRFSQQLE